MLNLLYIDPAATSALISSITAIVVAIGATGIILWRKFKKGVSKTLHIDENANKEVEDDLVVNDESLLNESAAEPTVEEVAITEDAADPAAEEVATTESAADPAAEEAAETENSEQND